MILSFNIASGNFIVIFNKFMNNTIDEQCQYSSVDLLILNITTKFMIYFEIQRENFPNGTCRKKYITNEDNNIIQVSSTFGFSKFLKDDFQYLRYWALAETCTLRGHFYYKCDFKIWHNYIIHNIF